MLLILLQGLAMSRCHRCAVELLPLQCMMNLLMSALWPINGSLLLALLRNFIGLHLPSMLLIVLPHAFHFCQNDLNLSLDGL